MESLMQWGVSFILWFQAWPVNLAAPMRLMTLLGTEEFFLLVMPALYWCVSAELGLRLAGLLIGSDALNSLVKLAFHLPRPSWIDPRVRALTSETSYGLPSNHAQTAAAIWGFLGAEAGRRMPARRWLAPVLAITLILLISLSRVYLGVHFPSDVLAGWLVGGLLLWAYWRWQPAVSRWLAGLGLAPQVALAMLVSVVYLALAAGAYALAGPADPAEWVGQAAAAAPDAEPIDPRSAETTTNSAGMLLGLGAGAACAVRWARFNAGGPWGQRALRFLLGVAGILLFWRGLALVLPTEPLAVGLAFRYLRYALTVYWALFLAPWLFLKLRLADRQAQG